MKNDFSLEKYKSKRKIADSINITSPEKLMFEEPAVTKMEVAEYYRKVSERMLPFVYNRLLSFVVCPKGIAEPCFYKKHPFDGTLHGVSTMAVRSSEGGEASNQSNDYCYITNSTGLVFEVQMNTIEFHTWGSRVEAIDKPDIMVFDLDPDEGMRLEQIRQGVRDLKSVLDQLRLTSYLKTSGNKGYHVVVPFKPSADWDFFGDFAKKIAKVMEQKWAERYTSNVRKVERKGKIFIDWIRNGRGATSIAPYSLRAKAGARVSMPIAWRELDRVAPNDITMADAVKRIKKADPWEDFFNTQANQWLR